MANVKIKRLLYASDNGLFGSQREKKKKKKILFATNYGCTTGCGYLLITAIAIRVPGYFYFNNCNRSSRSWMRLLPTAGYSVILNRLLTG